MPKKVYSDDDGRTIVNMNVDGMPWYNRHSRSRTEAPKDSAKPNWRESLRDWFSVALAGLVVVACCALPIVGFIAFCTNVWFK